MSAGVDPETAEAVNELNAVQVIEVVDAVRPFYERGVGRNRFPVLEPARVYIDIEIFDRFVVDLLFFGIRERVLFNESYNLLRFSKSRRFVCSRRYQYPPLNTDKIILHLFQQGVINDILRRDGKRSEKSIDTCPVRGRDNDEKRRGNISRRRYDSAYLQGV